MNLDEALDWLYNVRRFGPNRTLEPTKRFLKLFGSPQNHFHSIHIGGTNGKGSTSAFTASILQAAGYKVGLYTSPHLERFNERVKINGQEINNDDIARLLSKARIFFEQMLNYPIPMPLRFFDIVTGVCFKYFEEQQVDFGVIEVGLGGRLDATNVLIPLVSIITNIGYEHVNILGPTLEDIAFEKAEIIKSGIPIVTAETNSSVLNVFEKKAKEQKTRVIKIYQDTNYQRLSFDSHGQMFNLKTRKTNYENLHIPLFGEHQITNAITAVSAIEALDRYSFNMPFEAIIQGLNDVYWPARLEVFHRDPLVVLDCAKDAEATFVVKETIQKDLNKRRIIAVISISSDKNIEGMIENLAQIVEFFIITKHSVTYRATEPEILINEIAKYGIPYEVYLDRNEAFMQALEKADPDDMILVIGSVYLAGDARTYYFNHFFEKIDGKEAHLSINENTSH
jgi:dihydrofolate synthase/folylpolyglutamate synthase